MEIPTIDIGIPEEARKEIAEGLNRVLADTYTPYLKTQEPAIKDAAGRVISRRYR